MLFVIGSWCCVVECGCEFLVFVKMVMGVVGVVLFYLVLVLFVVV